MYFVLYNLLNVVSHSDSSVLSTSVWVSTRSVDRGGGGGGAYGLRSIRFSSGIFGFFNFAKLLRVLASKFLIRTPIAAGRTV